ncbi:MAG: diaminopimelate epimerase [Clostridiales bacterium]|jgi:diaminopimelate epimerase|nr:diaminopimelate epimerase [Clostridiales bacterium]
MPLNRQIKKVLILCDRYSCSDTLLSIAQSLTDVNIQMIVLGNCVAMLKVVNYTTNLYISNIDIEVVSKVVEYHQPDGIITLNCTTQFGILLHDILRCSKTKLLTKYDVVHTVNDDSQHKCIMVVVRDAKGNTVVVSSVYAGLYTVVPAIALTAKQYSVVKDTAVQVAQSHNIIGVCNVELSIDNLECLVLDINTSITHIHNLIYRATNYNLTKVATKISVGYNLDEIECDLAQRPCMQPIFENVALSPSKNLCDLLGLNCDIREYKYEDLVQLAKVVQHNVADEYLSIVHSIAQYVVFEYMQHSNNASVVPNIVLSDTVEARLIDNTYTEEGLLYQLYSTGNTRTNTTSTKPTQSIKCKKNDQDDVNQDKTSKDNAQLTLLPYCMTVSTTDEVKLSTRNMDRLWDIRNLPTRPTDIKFVKMHGAGNDYVYIDCRKRDFDILNVSTLAIQLSDRHYGIGGDGIVLICKSNVADAKMLMYNADGSQGAMCGNAIRCVAKYLYDNGIVKHTSIKIDTSSGIKDISVLVQDSKVASATVNMGKCQKVHKCSIPLLDVEVSQCKDAQLFDVYFVDIGNPHCVVFLDCELQDLNIEALGKYYQHNSVFGDINPNVEFVNFRDNSVYMRVWERGSGETLACGTGACASVIACIERGLCSANMDILVHLKGGTIVVNLQGDDVLMTGDCNTVFEGVIQVW